MNTVHANARRPMSTTQYHDRSPIVSHDALVIATNAVSVAVLLVLEAVTLWVLLSAMYFAPWAVQ